MPTRRATSLLALLPTLAPTAGELSYRPAPGAEDTVAWTVTHSLHFVRLEAELEDGEELGVPELEMAATRTRAVVLEQRHVGADAGVPTALQRSYPDIAEAFEWRLVSVNDGLDESVAAELDAPLEGRTVRFWRDELEGRYERVFVDPDGTEHAREPELLAGLAPDAHLGGLLANVEETRVGATWSAAPEVVAALVAPGGDLGGPLGAAPPAERAEGPVIAGLDPRAGMDLRALLVGPGEGALEGALACELTALDAEAKTATVALDVDVQVTRDVLARVATWTRVAEVSAEIEVTRATAFLSLRGRGEVTWSLETGLATAVTLELELAYRLEREVDATLGDGIELTALTRLELEGTLDATMAAR